MGSGSVSQWYGSESAPKCHRSAILVCPYETVPGCFLELHNNGSPVAVGAVAAARQTGDKISFDSEKLQEANLNHNNKILQIFRILGKKTITLNVKQPESFQVFRVNL